MFTRLDGAFHVSAWLAKAISLLASGHTVLGGYEIFIGDYCVYVIGVSVVLGTEYGVVALKI
jgi:hypothetical protein